ncbi:hypothetical protein UFOVP699_70 [uncultured Caudovirales phage]|uniref:Uncharacterized protein n=1 Tax=uncultured Caudovirales phage TaxID=2100421 RepID=A0A6J5NP91_9CAUD|nr:hypothetical protein UFOVP699_70 [uncultured Caudovirales phage]
MAANNKSGISRENRAHLKDEISALLQSIGTESHSDMVIDTEISEKTRPESPYDFEEMSNQFTVKAREITDSLFKNFVDIGIFEKNDYARHKKELDTINISNLFFQLKTIKITIIKVMEEITSGNTHPRLIEVMGQLQDKMASITKMQANYVLFLEDTYRQLNSAAPVNPDSEIVNSSSKEGQFFITVGTKNLINNLPDEPKTDEIKVPTGSLLDPSKKSDLMRERNIEITDDETGDDFIDLTEII